MTNTKQKTDGTLIVQSVDDGYRVARFVNGEPQPVNSKVYFHPTSAYAALGRIANAENVTALGPVTDPAKRPKQ